MSFLSWQFAIFFLFFLIGYYLPIFQNVQYVILLIGSYIFYALGNPIAVPILFGTTVLTYLGGFVLNRHKQRRWFVLFFVLNLAILFIFKYTDFAIESINAVGTAANGAWQELPLKNLILPAGLSFYVFQSTTYLNDIYRRGMAPEKNFFRYAAFVSFFPTLLSGPIQRSRDLLPQLRHSICFDSDRAIKGMLLFIWGIFEKVCVANMLVQIVNAGYDTSIVPDQMQIAYYFVAAISFSLYIYAGFSSYSDMARGLSKILGLEVGRNFENPYASTTLAEFWRRWHVSLNDWFVENIYIPLGGSRKGAFRKQLNVFIVFLISGLWHGASWNFVLWGVVNGILVIIGNLLRPAKTNLYCLLHVDENVESIVFLRRVLVCWFITLTWVFFRNDIETSLLVLQKLVFLNPAQLLVSDLWTIAGSETQTVLTILFAVFFCLLQYKRRDESSLYKKFQNQPFFFQCLALAGVLFVCVQTAASSAGTVNTNFLYFNF